MSVTAKKSLSPLQDTLILAGWLAGLLVVAGLIWLLSGSFREGILLKRINRLLKTQGYSWVLSSPISSRPAAGGMQVLGSWYRISGPDQDASACVFPLFADGIGVLCLARLNRDAKVEELVALTVHGERVFSRIPEAQKDIYMRRIEKANPVKAAP
ncbi:MAG: hypothetical protein LBE10_12070 [Treponema sp.]|jgi:hypothetical protein|nr:hypothetical protein [Treponema sp.]